MKTLTAAFLLFMASFSFGQTEQWTPINTTEGVEISFRYADCEFNAGYDERRVLLKITNTTSDDAIIDWDTKIWYNGECHNCDRLYEMHKSIEIKAGETRKGVCSRTEEQSLYLFVDFVKEEANRVLTDFELVNIQVTF